MHNIGRGASYGVRKEAKISISSKQQHTIWAVSEFFIYSFFPISREKPTKPVNSISMMINLQKFNISLYFRLCSIGCNALMVSNTPATLLSTRGSMVRWDGQISVRTEGKLPILTLGACFVLCMQKSENINFQSATPHNMSSFKVFYILIFPYI